MATPHAQRIWQILLELEKAEHGLAMPYDRERVLELMQMLHDAQKAAELCPEEELHE